MTITIRTLTASDLGPADVILEGAYGPSGSGHVARLRRCLALQPLQG